MVQAVLFDFGGVIADEGFREGLKAIARMNGLDPDDFYSLAADLVYSTGYVLGRATEQDYWNAVRDRTGISSSDDDLRREILDRFIVRTTMIDIARAMKKEGFTVGMLSDQTDWLEELDRSQDFLRFFDPVYNSYNMHKGKKDVSVFSDVSSDLGIEPWKIVFIDDNEGNIARAAAVGYKTIHFTGVDHFLSEAWKLFGVYP